jgi:putative transposase
LTNRKLRDILKVEMQRSFKYRIYPDKEQLKVLLDSFKFCRFLYNSGLEERIKYYKRFGRGLSYYDQTKQLPEIKKMFAAETEHLHSQCIQQVLQDLDRAFKNFFIRHSKGLGKGYPRFKKESQFKSICFPQPKPDLSAGCIKLLSNKKVKISGLGEVEIVLHRSWQGKVLQVRIKKESNKWYLVLSCKDVPLNILPATGKTVAIDLGLISFITTDTGQVVHHPKPWKTSKQKLANTQRKLALKQKNSKNRKRLLVELQNANKKVHNIREDFRYKLANKLVKENDTITVENLNVANMMMATDGKVNKNNITDAAWSSFLQKLSYKAESAGRKIIEVEPRNPSKICSCCGKLNKSLTLADRIFNCKYCSFSIDRDVNAALNIKRLGLSLAVGKTTSETPVL